jgi:hypothetical protein
MAKYYWIVKLKQQWETLVYLVQLWLKALRQGLGKLVEDPGIMGEQLSGGIRWQLQGWPINPR